MKRSGSPRSLALNLAIYLLAALIAGVAQLVRSRRREDRPGRGD